MGCMRVLLRTGQCCLPTALGPEGDSVLVLMLEGMSQAEQRPGWDWYFTVSRLAALGVSLTQPRCLHPHATPLNMACTLGLPEAAIALLTVLSTTGEYLEEERMRQVCLWHPYSRHCSLPVSSILFRRLIGFQARRCSRPV